MITSYTEESPTKKTMTLEVPVEDVRRVTEKTVRTLAKKVHLPGFRPGKAPVEMIRRRFADEIKGDVVDHLVQDAVGAALKEKDLVPLGRPKVEDLKFEFDAPLSFRVDLEVRPRVVIQDYRGLKVPSESAVPSEAEVDVVLQRLRESHATYEPIEGRPAADGDFALVDLKGTYPAGDGKDFEAEKTLVEVGGERTMPELTAHVRNAEPGVTVTFQKDFSPDGPDPAFAGKTVLYTVTLVALKTRVLPAVDEEFARLVLTPKDGDAPENAGLPLLKERITDSLTREKEMAAHEKKRRAVLDGLLALNEVHAPESMVESEIDSALREYARQLSRSGIDLKEAKIDWNALRGEARPSAERRVKEYLLLDAIGDAEGTLITDTELDAELKRRAQAMGTSFGELKSALSKADRLEGVREELRIERVVSFLISEAVTAA